MRTTKQLSKLYLALQKEAMDKIKSFFDGKPYIRIVIDANQNLRINTGISIATVTEIHHNGDILFTQFLPGHNKVQRLVNRAIDHEPLPVDALLTILDELERMKKANLLKKP